MPTEASTEPYEAVKLVEAKAPAIVDEQILAHMLDEVAEFTGDIMGKADHHRCGRREKRNYGTWNSPRRITQRNYQADK
jgi:hypothetical protein